MSAPIAPSATRPVLVAVALAAALVAPACDDSSPVKETPVGGGAIPVDAGAVPRSSDGGAAGDGGAKDCFDDPKTHFEIINACTTATRIAKSPSLTKLLPDGGLPLLP